MPAAAPRKAAMARRQGARLGRSEAGRRYRAAYGRPSTLGLDVLTYGATWAAALETVRLADVSATTRSSRPTTSSRPAATRTSRSSRAGRLLAGLGAGDAARRISGCSSAPTRSATRASSRRWRRRSTTSAAAARSSGSGAAWEVEEQRRPRHRSRAEPRPAAGLARRVADDRPAASWPARRSPRTPRRTGSTASGTHRCRLQEPMPVIDRRVRGEEGPADRREARRPVADLGPIDDVDEFQRLDGVLRRHCDAVGRDEATIRRMLGAKVIVRPTRAAAEREFERQLRCSHGGARSWSTSARASGRARPTT